MSHPAHDKADYISKNVPEVAALYHGIGTRSYSDHASLSLLRERPEGYDPFDVPEDEIAGEALFAVRIGKKDQIDNILWNLAYNELDNEPDTRGFKDAAVALAQQYVTLEWLHTPWTTSKILTQVLDSELVPLKKQAFGSVPSMSAALIPGVWGPILDAALFLVGVIARLWITIALFDAHHPVFGLLASAYVAWVYGHKALHAFRVRRERRRLAELYGQLQLIRDEVASGCFDPEEVDRRLRRSEENGLYVHSLSHALLRISPRTEVKSA